MILRDQTVHWMAHNFCLYAPEFQRQVFKHVKFCSTIDENERTKEEHWERPCWRIRLHFPKSTV